MNPNKIKQLESHKIYRELVAAVVEHVLLGISLDAYDVVNAKLKENYDITTDDVFDHPESLKYVLCNLYDGQYDDIYKKIVFLLFTFFLWQRLRILEQSLSSHTSPLLIVD